MQNIRSLLGFLEITKIKEIMNMKNIFSYLHHKSERETAVYFGIPQKTLNCRKKKISEIQAAPPVSISAEISV